MGALEIALLLVCTSIITALIMYLAPSLRYGIGIVINSSSWTNVWTAVVAVATVAAFIYLALTYYSNERLFKGQNTPLIDVTPVAIGLNEGFTTTIFSVTNYSGFPAYHIGIDVKYADAWIVEWLKAQKNIQNGETSIQQKKPYVLAPAPLLDELRPGETSSKYPPITGQFDLQKEVCPTANGVTASGRHPVQVRVSWQNEGDIPLMKSINIHWCVH
jgi:hypothetical protein